LLQSTRSLILSWNLGATYIIISWIAMTNNKTLTSCLGDLDITGATVFDNCDNTDDEFKLIKKNWRKKVLAEHPDKGGDPDKFRTTNASFEVLRDLYQEGKVKDGTYSSYLTESAKAEAAESDIDIDDLFNKYCRNTNVPSWEYFARAAEEEIPTYKVETARSGRSKCTVCKNNSSKAVIAERAASETSAAIVASATRSSSRAKKNSGGVIQINEIRVGSMDEIAGSYGRWHHLECWRVPKKVQNGLTNPMDEESSLRDLLSMEEVLLTGLAALDEENQMAFVRHVIDSDHWAGNRKRKAGSASDTSKAKNAKVASKTESTSRAAKSGKKSTGPTANIVPGSYSIPVPGVGGAVDDENFLKGMTFVLTGIFIEVGGGDDDSIGVENLKSMIESFGGKVTTRFSKNTNFLLAGNNPVAKRFKDARAKSIDIINLVRLNGLLKGQLTFDRLDKLEALDSEEFMGSAYQPATNAGVTFCGSKPVAAKTEAKESAAAKREAKKPVAVKADEIPPLKSDQGAKPKPAVTSQALVAHANPSESTRSSSTAIMQAPGKKSKFHMPRPGKNGAIAGVFDGQRFVLTGLFPELGGGGGLNYGKDKMKTLIENFGGRVTGSVSGKTNFVVVGKDPGASKVSKATTKSIPLVDLLALNRVM